MRASLPAAALLFVPLMACSASPPDPLGTAVRQVALTFGTAPRRDLFLVVLDDANDAAPLRAEAREHLARALARRGESRGFLPSDPASLRNADVRVYVARPSAPRATRLVGPTDDARLRLHSTRVTRESLDALAEAAVDVASREVEAPGTYAPLATLDDALALLEGARGPRDGHEAALRADVADGPVAFTILVASTRDDAGTEPVPAYDASASRHYVGALVGGGTGEDSCWVTPDPATRLGAWLSAANAVARVAGCRPPGEHDGLFDATSCFAPYCFSAPLRRDQDGSVACRVFVERVGDATCDPTRGLDDPEDPQALTDYGGTRLPACEVKQLTGDALAACRTTRECEGCGSGFCFTEVREVLPRGRGCGRADREPSLRIVGAAFLEGRARLVCDLAP